jgi:hypothetical protein
MKQVRLKQGDRIKFILGDEDYWTQTYSDDLLLISNTVLVVNNGLCKTGKITQINDYTYEVKCKSYDGLIVQDDKYFGLQSELD